MISASVAYYETELSCTSRGITQQAVTAVQQSNRPEHRCELLVRGHIPPYRSVQTQTPQMPLFGGQPFELGMTVTIGTVMCRF
jgi:hypothetical protein